MELVQEAYHVPQPDTRFEDNIGQPTWLAGESQVDDLDSLGETLLCKEIFGYSTDLNGSAPNPISNTDFNNNTYGVTGNSSTSCGIHDLENIELDSPPDFQLAVSFLLTLSSSALLDFYRNIVLKITFIMQDLQFCSQDSLLNWLDRL